MPTDTANSDENLHLDEEEREEAQRPAPPRQPRRWATVVQALALVVALTLALYNNDGSSGHEWYRWSHGELSDDWIVIAR